MSAMLKRAQLDDVVKIRRGHQSGMLGRVIQVSPDLQLAKLTLTSNDLGHWFYVKELMVMYRPNVKAA